mmetsp:Transcript_23849/g.61430  ORF Transcript_23849/g.61430 Transcript_23849/m.61430 type:complete len:286 (+) Transcript_23849:220-1077(+)
MHLCGWRVLLPPMARAQRLHAGEAGLRAGRGRPDAHSSVGRATEQLRSAHGKAGHRRLVPRERAQWPRRRGALRAQLEDAHGCIGCARAQQVGAWHEHNAQHGRRVCAHAVREHQPSASITARSKGVRLSGGHAVHVGERIVSLLGDERGGLVGCREHARATRPRRVGPLPQQQRAIGTGGAQSSVRARAEGVHLTRMAAQRAPRQPLERDRRQPGLGRTDVARRRPLEGIAQSRPEGHALNGRVLTACAQHRTLSAGQAPLGRLRRRHERERVHEPAVRNVEER